MGVAIDSRLPRDSLALLVWKRFWLRKKRQNLRGNLKVADQHVRKSCIAAFAWAIAPLRFVCAATAEMRVEKCCVYSICRVLGSPRVARSGSCTFVFFERRCIDEGIEKGQFG